MSPLDIVNALDRARVPTFAHRARQMVTGTTA
jgi:hypothetical protein